MLKMANEVEPRGKQVFSPRKMNLRNIWKRMDRMHHRTFMCHTGFIRHQNRGNQHWQVVSSICFDLYRKGYLEWEKEDSPLDLGEDIVLSRMGLFEWWTLPRFCGSFRIWIICCFLEGNLPLRECVYGVSTHPKKLTHGSWNRSWELW